jgi:integrase
MIDESFVDVLAYEKYLRDDKMLQESTIYNYCSAMKKFFTLGGDINDIEHVNGFILEHAIKKRSIYYWDAMKSFINYKLQGTKKAYMLRNMLPKKVPDPKRYRRYLSDEEREAVIKTLKDNKHRLIARIQNETGVRAGEVIRLKRGTIAYEPYQDKVVMRINFTGKGGKRFVKWIFDEQLQADIDVFIKGRLFDTEHYFLERDKCRPDSVVGQVLRTNYNWYWHDMKEALTKLGYDFKDWASHDFRRAYARKVWDKFHDPALLKDAMNHGDFNTTLTYLRTSGLQVQEIANALDEEKRRRFESKYLKEQKQ